MDVPLITALATDAVEGESRASSLAANQAMVRRLGLHHPVPVGLEPLVENAALTERTDRKYIVTVSAAREMVRRMGDTHAVLSIDGRRYTTYRTMYLDTDDFTSARAHIQRRRRRWKVRTRLYVEDQLNRVEVKTKANRGNTTKVMRVSHPDFYGTLSDEDRAFVTEQLGDLLDAEVGALKPAAEVRYTRATLSDLTAGTRVTLDWGMTMHLEPGHVWLDDQFVTVETKGPGPLSRVDRTLHELGIRPRRFSKYVSAASSVYADLPGNDFTALRSRQMLHSSLWGL